MREHCLFCDFFLLQEVESDHPAEGICRRFPPVRLPDEEFGSGDEWSQPWIYYAEESWCGEFKHKTYNRHTPFS